MTPKGYIVRGIGQRSGRTLYAEREFFCATDRRAGAATYGSLSEACDAIKQLAQCHSVRILAVAEDGTETPLPTYEEALTKLAELDAIGEALLGDMG